MRKAPLFLIVLFVTLFALSLDGCATVPVPNVEFCADKGTIGAVCDYTNDGPETQLNKLEWDQKRFGMACAEVEAITKLLGVIKKLCFDTGRCSIEEYRELESRMFEMYRKLGLDATRARMELETTEPL